MKNLITLAVMAMLLVCSGCGDSREAVAEDGMANMKELVATLDTVKDEASAKAAKPKLEKLVKQMNEIKERQTKLGDPTEAEMKSLMEKHGDEMEALQKKMVTVMMRIQFDPEIQKVLSDIDMKAMR